MEARPGLLYRAGTTNNLWSVYFPNTNTGYAVGDNGTILKTTNGGVVPLVSPSNRSVSSSAGTTHFIVTSDTNWIVTSDASWCNVTPSGSGNDSIIANYSENTSVSSRVAKITVYVEGLDSITVTVSQSGIQPQLVVLPLNQDVSALIGSTTFSVTANSDWTAVSDTSWCTVTPSGSGNGTIVADYSENTLASARVAHIKVSFPGLSLPVQNVTVTQSRSSIGFENIMEEEFQVYPNPSNGIFKIVPGQINKESLEVTIQDLQGKVILRKQFLNDKKYEIDLSNATQGFYHVILKLDDQVLVRNW